MTERESSAFTAAWAGGSGRVGQHRQVERDRMDLVEDPLGLVEAAAAGRAAAGAHGQLGQAGAAGGRGLAGLMVGDTVADTDVHARQTGAVRALPFAFQMRMIV